MLHPEILEEIYQERKVNDFVYPFYEKYSIAEIAPSIQRLLGITPTRTTFPSSFFSGFSGSYEKIITCIVDGLGYDHFEHYHTKLAFFHDLASKGEVFPITSVFPSTTPAALTTIHTGRPAQEDGLPEWTVYFQEFDCIIEPILFRKQKTSARDGLLEIGATPDILFEGSTLYTKLRDVGIPSYYFMYEEYFPSAYSSVTTKGSKVVTFHHGNDLIVKLRHALETTKEQAYFFIYWSFIDSVEHAFGPNSVQHSHALAAFNDLFTTQFLQKLKPEGVKNTLFLLSADHGQTRIRGEDILYLGKYEYLNDTYLYNKNGEKILPTGAPHDVFLFIQPAKVQEIVTRLQQDLEGKAEVITTTEAIARGLFGIRALSTNFLNRTGTVLILPYPGVHVWYEHFPPETFLQNGTHGVLSTEEMIVPFAIAELDKLLS